MTTPCGLSPTAHVVAGLTCCSWDVADEPRLAACCKNEPHRVSPATPAPDEVEPPGLLDRLLVWAAFGPDVFWRDR